jgi:hypothetical protein
MEKNKKIENVLNSFDNMQLAEMSPFVKAKLIHRIFDQEQNFDMPFKKSLVLMSLCAILFFVNAVMLSQASEQRVKINNHAVSAQNEFSNEYDLNTTSIFYYDDKQ